MRFVLLLKSDKDSEAGPLPDGTLLGAMGKYNEELVKAGVLLAAEGLVTSSRGARIKLAGAARTVTDGPFSEAKDLIYGFWLIEAKSKDEAIEWAKRCPGAHGEVEVRQVFELSEP